MNVCSNPGEDMDCRSDHIGSPRFDCRMENPRRNPFFSGVFDSPNGSASSLLAVDNDANSRQCSEGNVTPTTLQRNLCLYATSDVDVNLTDEEGAAESPSVLPPVFCRSHSKQQSSIALANTSVMNGSGVITSMGRDEGKPVTVDFKSISSTKQPAVGTRKTSITSNACVCAGTNNAKALKEVGGVVGGGTTEAIPNAVSFPSKKSPITDEYKITHEIIGIGESGKVMACFSRTNNEKYALKVLRDGPRSRREVYLHYLTQKHENIVTIIDIFENTFDGVKCLLIVVEFLEGGDLLTRFENQGRFPYSEKYVSKIIAQISSAVKYLHDMNVAHRDLKLENILCSSSDLDNCVYKLADFGFAKQSDCNMLMESPCCTPTYVCPEILGHLRYDKSCDMWALGVVMYILLCGYPPFYSMKGLPFSPGMKDRITVGLYAFPAEDWDHISESAKNEIRNLLRTDPATRTTVDELLAGDFLRCGGKRPRFPMVASDSSLSSLDDYRTPKSQSPATDNNNDSAIGNSSDYDSDNSCSRKRETSTVCRRLNFCTTLHGRETESACDFFAFEKDPSPARFIIGTRSCAASTMRFRQRKEDGAMEAEDDSEETDGDSDSSTRTIRHNPTASHTVSARYLMQPSRAAATQMAKPPRLYSIQEEVGRALEMIRLGANEVVLRAPRAENGNRLLQRRRRTATAAAAANNSPKVVSMDVDS